MILLRKLSGFSLAGAPLVLLALWVDSGSAQRTPIAREIDAYVAPFSETNNFAGQLLVTRGEKVVYERELGWENRGERRLVTPSSRLHIASVSMQFTAAAIMRLVDQKKLSLDTRVSELVPSVRGGEAISIRNLLEHRSGLSDINARGDYAQILKAHQTPASLVAVIAGDSLLFPPGSKSVHEEHSAYNLLALIIEKTTGLPFARAMQKLVFGPAGLTHTSADDDEGARQGALARGYEPKGVFALDTTTPIHWSAKSGNASIYSTAADEARWVRLLFRGRFLSEASRAAIVDSAGVSFGYGWFRRPNKRFGEFAYSMNGRSPGFASFVLYLPREDLTVVALSNIYSSATTDIGYDIAAIALGVPYTRIALSAHPLSPDSLALDGARFTFPSDFYQPDATLEFRNRGGELFLGWPSGEWTPVIPIDRDHAFDRAYWQSIVVTRDPTGRASAIMYDRFRGVRTDSVTADSSRK